MDPELERYAAKRQKKKNEYDKEMRVKKEEAAARTKGGKDSGKGS